MSASGREQSFGSIRRLVIGFSNAIGRPKKGPEKALGRACRGPKYASLGVWRLGAGELAGL